jgi:hypothetical protein
MFIFIGPLVKSLVRNVETPTPPTDYFQGIAMASASLTAQLTHLVSIVKKSKILSIPLDETQIIIACSVLVVTIGMLLVVMCIQRDVDHMYARLAEKPSYTYRNAFRHFMANDEMRGLFLANNFLGFLPLIGFTMVRGL